MKNLVLVAAIAFSAQFAQAQCQGEAQVVAKVATTSFSLSQGCKVTLKDVTFYESNPVCPLSIDVIQTLGLTVGTANGHECALEVNDTVSGVVVDKGFKLVLE